MLDLSILKSIDFKDSDNLLFFSIVLFLTVLIFLVFFFVIAEIIGSIKRSFKAKQGYVVKDMDEMGKTPPQVKQESMEKPKQRLSEGVFSGGVGSVEKNKTEIKLGGKKAEEAKDKQRILDQLNKFKKDNPSGAGMPSSASADKGEEGHETIVIPVAKKIEKEENGGSINAQQSIGETTSASSVAPSVGAKKSMPTAGGVVSGQKSGNDSGTEISIAGHSQKTEKTLLNEKPVLSQPDFMNKDTRVAPNEDVFKKIGANKDKNPLKISQSTTKNNQSIGGSIMFGNKDEVSRIELRQKLRSDPKIYRAQREAGLYNLNKISRAKMEKDLFSIVYGRNISKKDLKLNIKKLEREHWGATDMKKKETLRKEIKFLKKIGGV